jgi:hypothetical protein
MCVGEYADYQTLRGYCVGELIPKLHDSHVLIPETVIVGEQKRDYLGHAIENCDLDLVTQILEMVGSIAYLGSPQSRTACIHAARLGHVAILRTILHRMRPDRDSFSFLLHWLFRFPESNMEEIAGLIVKAAGDGADILNHVTGQSMHLHAQWPFPMQGTPLATAIACGNLQAIQTLLKLGADPVSRSTVVFDTDNIDGKGDACLSLST